MVQLAGDAKLVTMTETETDTFVDGSGIGIATLESKRGAVNEIQEDSPIKISGVVIPENQILRGGLEVEHFFSPQRAQEAATVLKEQIADDEQIVHLVKNFHEPEGQAVADEIIGEVTAAGYQKGVGVVFEAETTDKETAQKIALGYLQISPSISRELGGLDETMQAREVTNVEGFRDIAVVGNGQRGVDVEVGPNPAVEALSRNLNMDTDTLEPEEPEEPEDPEPEFDEALETVASEYDMDTDELVESLTQSESESNTVKLIESD